MADYFHDVNKFGFAGVDLRSAVDQLPKTRFRIAKNVRATDTGALKTRPGTTNYVNMPAGVNSIIPMWSTYFLFGCTDGNLYRQDAVSLDNGFDGLPLTYVNYRMSGTSQPWAIIADLRKMSKCSITSISGLVLYYYQLGITPPATAVVSAVGGAISGGPDSSLGVNYDWRGTYYSSLTQSESNPSPIQAALTAVVNKAVKLTLAFSADTQVGVIRFYRRGGTLGDNWRLLGQRANQALTITAISRATNVVTLTTNVDHKMLDGQGVNISGVTDASFDGDFGPITVTSATQFTYAQVAADATSSGGTVQFDDIYSDAQINAATLLATDNDVPVTTIDQNTGAVVYGQPLPFIWGPYLGKTIFGCGDPNRPGYLYWDNPANPDAWSSLNNVEVVSPDDPLQNGFIWNGTPWVFSHDRLFQIYQNVVGTNQFLTVDAQAGHGLWAAWGIAAGPNTPAFWWTGREAIYQSTGGQGQSITDNDLWPLFHGETKEGNGPIDWSHQDKIRLAFFDNEVWFTFQDTLGANQVWVNDTFRQTWRQYSYPSSVLCVTPIPATYFGGSAFPEQLYLGLLGGHVSYQDTNTFPNLYTDEGTNISCQVRTGFYDGPDPLKMKEYGSLVSDLDTQGASVTPTVYFSDTTSTSVVCAVEISVGRSQFAPSLNDTYARSYAVDYQWTSSVGVTLFGYECVMRPDELPIMHFESPPMSYGMAGYGYIYDGYIGLRSAADVTVSLVWDNGTAQTVTVASTSGARLRTYVQFPAIKGKVVQVKLDSSQPFRLYREDSYLNLWPWGSQAPAQIRPFVS